MFEYTDEDIEAYEEAAKELAGLVKAARLAPALKQEICSEMDRVIQNINAKRMNRVIGASMKDGDWLKPSLRRPMSIKDLAGDES